MELKGSWRLGLKSDRDGSFLFKIMRIEEEICREKQI